MASDDPNYNSLHQTNVGCFGLFESIDNRDVAAALFETAANWLRKKGRSEIMARSIIQPITSVPCDRWIPVSAHHLDRAQSTVLPAADRGLWLYKSEGLVRVVVC